MFKVLIVDDEPYIRKGLVNIINWKNYGCEICGEASDGVEGLEKIASLTPDIVFVDINMPEINGLDMIRQSKELMPKSKFIILTGYRDFSYIQEAIKVGAYDYILKPSKIEEISDILKRAVLELKMEREEEQEHEKLKAKFEESVPILKEKLLYDLMDGHEMTKDEMAYQLSLYQLELQEYLIMFVSVDGENMSKDMLEQRHLYQFGVSNTVMDLYGDNFHVERVVLNPQVIAFIIESGKTGDVKLEKAAQLAGNVQQLIRRCFGFTVTMAISNIGYGPEALYEKAQECEACLAYRFYMGPDSVILHQDLMGFYRSRDLSSLDRHEKQIIGAIQAGDEHQVTTLLDELKREIIESNANPEQIKHYYWTMVYNINHIRLSMKALEKTVDEMSHDMSSLYHMIDESGNILEIHELLYTVATSIVTKINQYNRQNINVTLQKAVDYIHQHYHQSITLQDLADEVYISTYYLSRMFTKELNKNFVDYLSEVRMNEAKRLMEDASLKTYEISERVGISDAHYFSKLFKKYVGMTPTDYRSQFH